MASFTAAMMIRACCRKRVPSAVSATPPGWRSNRRTARSDSSCLIAAVTADCETLSSIAAWLTCPASAAAMKYLTCLIESAICFYDTYLQFFRFYNLAVATQYSWEGGSRPAWTGREDVDKPTKALAGQRVRRKEDLRFITGEGRYLDDIR